MTRPIVEVSPPEAFARIPRLLAALSDALEVQFASAATTAPPAARIAIAVEPSSMDLPTLVLGASTGEPAETGTVRFSGTPSVPIPLREWSIPDRALPGTGTLEPGRAEVLATVSERPVWTTEWRDGVRIDRAVLVPEELAPDDTLLGRFAPGSYFDILPLLHFCRSLERSDAWSLPPLLAAFIMDDPNLRSDRYGYLDFDALTDRGFHTCMATIPLDGWYTRRRTVELFRSNPDTLSLMVHGNNHTRHELEDGRDAAARLSMLAQALRRVRSQGARTGVPVAEVMAAPHGRCSEASGRDMARLGYEALCISHPFPWLPRPPGEYPLAGWHPADTSTPTPALPRILVSEAPELLPLRAYLGQPVIVFGHHWDLADQRDLLDTWAAHIDQLGDVTWASVGEISRRMFSWRQEGDTFQIRPHTRVVEVDLPVGTTRLIVTAPPGTGYEYVEINDAGRVSRLPRGQAAWDIGHGEKVTVRLIAEDAIGVDDVPAPPWRPWPVLRRLLTEARDRSRPRIDAIRRR